MRTQCAGYAGSPTRMRSWSVHSTVMMAGDNNTSPYVMLFDDTGVCACVCVCSGGSKRVGGAGKSSLSAQFSSFACSFQVGIPPPPQSLEIMDPPLGCVRLVVVTAHVLLNFWVWSGSFPHADKHQVSEHQTKSFICRSIFIPAPDRYLLDIALRGSGYHLTLSTPIVIPHTREGFNYVYGF